jgi:hypothetical protein
MMYQTKNPFTQAIMVLNHKYDAQFKFVNIVGFKKQYL